MLEVKVQAMEELVAEVEAPTMVEVLLEQVGVLQ
jgi:hypothetical protein